MGRSGIGVEKVHGYTACRRGCGGGGRERVDEVVLPQ